MSLLLRNSVFLHIPKTGGTWVKAALKRAGLIVGVHTNYHGTIEDMKEEPEAQGLPMFAFVRRPDTWLASYWGYRMATWKFNRDFDQVVFDTSFEKFVWNCSLFVPQGLAFQHFQHYIGEGDSRIQHIGRIENLTEDLITILQETGEDFDPEVIRSTPRERVECQHMRDRAILTPKLARLIWRTNWRTFGEFYALDNPESGSQ